MKEQLLANTRFDIKHLIIKKEKWEIDTFTVFETKLVTYKEK